MAFDMLCELCGEHPGRVRTDLKQGDKVLLCDPCARELEGKLIIASIERAQRAFQRA